MLVARGVGGGNLPSTPRGDAGEPGPRSIARDSNRLGSIAPRCSTSQPRMALGAFSHLHWPFARGGCRMPVGCDREAPALVPPTTDTPEARRRLHQRSPADRRIALINL